MKVRHSAATVLIVVFSMAMYTSAAAVVIPWETRTGFMRSGIYGWNYSYDIGFFDDVLMIDVDVALMGDDPGVDLKHRWESGIEDIWSTGRFGIPILFNVDWVSSDYDQGVTVVDGTARWDMVTWYTVGASGWGDAYQDDVAAHEFGHMISMWDEYTGGAINPLTGLIDTGGLMHTLDGPTLDYYYDPFLGWYEDRRAVFVPQSGTILLMGTGLGALIFGASRRKR